jgi:DNA-binding IclR family transcriptional regulator
VNGYGLDYYTHNFFTIWDKLDVATPQAAVNTDHIFTTGMLRHLSPEAIVPAQSTAESSAMAIQVLGRATQLLDALAAQPDPVALKDLAKTTGLHTSTAHRILSDLVIGRYVDRVDSGLYQLGMRLLELGSLVKGRLNVREAAREAMHALHRLTGQTVNLSVQQGDEIIYIDRAWSERSGMQVVRAIGGRAPLHLTSTGKLFLSAADSRQVRTYATRTALAASTSNSLTTLDKLEQELVAVRQLGYARDNEELEMGVRCIAAGIYDDTGKLVAGLSISAPSSRLQDDWIPLLVSTAGRISEALGYEASAT